MSTKKVIVSPYNEKLILLPKPEEKQKFYLSNLIDNININNLGSSYYKEDSLFKKRLEKLNFKFYTETEKFLTNKQDMESSQDQLFVILFKQISLYMEENERLNQLLKEKSDSDKNLNKDDFHKKEREKLATQQTINYLKASNMNIEKKMSDKNKVEEKLKQENESLKRQLKFYKDKLQLEVNVKKTTTQIAKKTNKISNLNSVNFEESHKIDKENYVKSEHKFLSTHKHMKSSTAYESGTINNLEITVNKVKNEDDKLSESSNKGRKSLLSDDIEEIQEDRENTKRSMASRNMQSYSPNNNLCLNFATALTSKNKQANTLKFPKQKQETKEVKPCSSTQNRSQEPPNKEKSVNNEFFKIDADDLKDLINNLNNITENELEELNNLESQLHKIRNGFHPKSELNSENYDYCSDLNSSPTNPKPKLSKNSSNQRSTLVTIDLNPIKEIKNIK